MLLKPGQSYWQMKVICEPSHPWFGSARWPSSFCQQLKISSIWLKFCPICSYLPNYASGIMSGCIRVNVILQLDLEGEPWFVDLAETRTVSGPAKDVAAIVIVAEPLVRVLQSGKHVFIVLVCRRYYGLLHRLDKKLINKENLPAKSMKVSYSSWVLMVIKCAPSASQVALASP